MNKQLLIKSINNVTSIENLTLSPIIVNGSPVTITTGELYVYEGDTIISSGTLAGGELIFPTGRTNELYYEWTTTEISSLDTPKANYKAVWIINTDLEFSRFFNICYYKLDSIIKDEDVIREKPEFDQYRPTIREVATSDSDVTMVVCDKLVQESDFWDGAIIELDSGSNNGERRHVADWNNSELLLSSDFPYPTRKGQQFTLRRSYGSEIESARISIQNLIQSWVPAMSTDNGMALIIDSYDFREMNLSLAIVKIASNLRRKREDTFDLIHQEYQANYEKAINQLRAKIDSANDGSQNSEDGVRTGTQWLQH